METILLMNAKGGSGKSTIATNLAAWFAMDGANVYLADLDQQGSCMDWLEVRSREFATIHGIPPSKSIRVPRGTDYVIMDAPGAIHGRAVDRLVRKVDTLLIPVAPSPVDIRATAKFIEELLLVRRIARHNTRVGVVANRVRSNNRSYESLQRFLDRLQIPMVGALRDSELYQDAAGNGRSIFEMAGEEAFDRQQEWSRLIAWVRGEAGLGKEELELLASLNISEPVIADGML
ncbi:MAG: AAA family ATPase [Gammaproteobacteria bacterium]